MAKKKIIKPVTIEDIDARIENSEALIFKTMRILVGQVNTLEKEVIGLCGSRAGLLEECAAIHNRVITVEENIQAIRERRKLK